MQLTAMPGVAIDMERFEPLPAPCHTRTETGETLTLILPPRRMWFQLVFTCLWLVGWAFAAVTVPWSLLASRARPISGGPNPLAFGIVWCLLWYAGGTMAILWILWQIRGREVVTARADGLFLRHEIFGIGRTRGYPSAQVRNLRTAPRPTFWESYWTRSTNPIAQWVGEGTIAFDYGSKTVRFGAGVDEAEARDIIADLDLHLGRREAVR